MADSDNRLCKGCASRREFLKLGAGAVALAASGVGMGGCGDEPNVDVLKRDLTIALSDHPGLGGEGASVLIEAGLTSPIAVTRTGAETFVASSTECNHAHCTVGRSGEGWRCPCHGSVFGLEGGLQKGPATDGLIAYDLLVDGDSLTIFGQ